MEAVIGRPDIFTNFGQIGVSVVFQRSIFGESFLKIIQLLLVKTLIFLIFTHS